MFLLLVAGELFTFLLAWFGAAQVWKDTPTEISFYNSLKMKMAIVFGVAHVRFVNCLPLFDLHRNLIYGMLLSTDAVRVAS